MRVLHTTVLKRTANQLSSIVDGEVILLNVNSGEYLNLNSVGTYIWNCFEHPRTIQQIIDLLVSEYDVSVGLCESETKPFLEELIALNLIEAIND